MLKMQDLWVSVGDRQVLKGVNFSMKYGEINMLFGPNGAGKTTLMMTLMGFPRYKIEQGKIYFKGQDITDKDLYERARLGLGVSFQRPPTVRGVTLRKIIEIIAGDGAQKSASKKYREVEPDGTFGQGAERWVFRRRNETFRASAADGTET